MFPFSGEHVTGFFQLLWVVREMKPVWLKTSWSIAPPDVEELTRWGAFSTEVSGKSRRNHRPLEPYKAPRCKGSP